MNEKNLITTYLSEHFFETKPIDFYRTIFPKNSFQTKGVHEQFLYNAIIIEITDELHENGKKKVLRHTVTDDLEKITEVIERDNFCIMSPIDYAGRKRDTSASRNLYALVIEIDGLIVKDNEVIGLKNLLHQFEIEHLPKPTFIVSSGNGIHLYFQMDEPIKLYPHILEKLEILKKELTRKIWNGNVTDLTGKDVQYEPVCQGFRVVGSITRKKTRASSFRVGIPINIDYLNSFVDDEFKMTDVKYQSEIGLGEARERWPEWHEKRVVKGLPKGAWCINSNVYHWWKKQILNDAKCGHRYWCLWVLSLYACKCSFYDEKKNPFPITEEQLEKDCFELLEVLDSRTIDGFDPFNMDDVLAALQGYDTSWATYPIEKIVYRSGITINKSKRNYRDRASHIKLMNFTREELNGNKDWAKNRGKTKGASSLPKKISNYLKNNPYATLEQLQSYFQFDPKTIKKYKEILPATSSLPKFEIIKKFIEENPGCKKTEIIKATGISKPTVYKYYNIIKSN